MHLEGDIPPGESMQTTHNGKNGWIEIGDWSWDVEAETSSPQGHRRRGGQAHAGALSFSHYYDKSSPMIMQNIVKGKHFKSVHDRHAQADRHAASRELYFQLT